VESSGKPNMDRVIRVLEYLTYACFLCERYQLPVGVHAMALMAQVRKKLATGMSCFRCYRQAELVAKGDCDASVVEKLAISEKDAASVVSKPVTATTAAAQSLAQSRGRPAVAAHRRKRGEETRKGDEDDVTEVFAKKSIDRIQTLYLDYVYGGGAPVHVSINGNQPNNNKDAQVPASPTNSQSPVGSGLIRTTSTINVAALATAVVSTMATDQEVPTPQYLADIPLPRVVCKAARYMCRACSVKHPSAEKEPIMKEPAVIFAKLASLAIQNKAAHASFDKNVIGEALLNVGTLETDPASVSTAVAELSTTFGPVSRVVVAASIQLADVLLETVNATPPVTTGTATVVVPPSAAGGTPSVVITHQQATVGVAQAEAVLHEALGKLLGRSDTTVAFVSELNTVVYKLQDIARIYSLHPVAKKEHAAAHYLAEVLPPALGMAHPLVGAAYNATKHYYVQLAKKRHDRVAASNALHTAGQYANLAIRSRVSSPENEDELDSLLTVMADDILKVLRASGAAGDRKASEDLFSMCKQTVMDSSYRTSPTLLHRLAVMEEIFKAQLKVMEQSEALSRLSVRLDDAKKEMLRLVKSIKRHRNRVDLYGHQCLRSVTDIKDSMVASCKGVTESSILDKLESVRVLHATLTKIPDDHNGNLDDADEGGFEGSVGGEWTAVLGSVTKNPLTDGNGNAKDEDNKEHGGAKAEASRASIANQKLSRVYTSPYAILGGAPNEVDDEQDDFAGQNANKQRGANNTGSHKHHRGGSSRHTNRSSGSRPPALTAAAQHYLEALTERPGTCGMAGTKQPETVDRLATLMPRLSQSAVARNHNPTRAYAQQVQKASSASLAAVMQAQKNAQQ
jgi:hypothetical protein